MRQNRLYKWEQKENVKDKPISCLLGSWEDSHYTDQGRSLQPAAPHGHGHTHTHTPGVHVLLQRHRRGSSEPCALPKRPATPRPLLSPVSAHQTAAVWPPSQDQKDHRALMPCSSEGAGEGGPGRAQR